MGEINTIEKPGYKHTKLGWIPEDWKVRKISEVFEFLPTNSYSRNKMNYDISAGSILNIHYGDIHATYKEPMLNFELEKEIPALNSDLVLGKNLSFLKEGDLIIADASEDYNGVGAAIELKNLNERKCVAGLHTLALRDVSDFTIKGFRAYIFKNPKVSKAIKVIATGSKVFGISKANLDKFQIILPPLPEQQKIAQILSTWDKAITKTEELIRKKQEQKKGLMQQLLTGKMRFREFKGERWHNTEIGNVIKFSGGSQPPRSTFRFEKQEGFIRLIQNRDYKTDKYKTYIPEDLAKKLCDESDIMIGRYGPPLFQIFRGLKGAYNVALIKAIPDESQITKEYCWYFINRPELQKYIDGFSQRSGGQTGIEMDRLNTYPLPLPSIKEQQKITSVLISSDKEISKLRSKLDQLRDQKKGLMQKLLTGEVRVKID